MLHVTLTVLYFHVALATINFTQLSGDAYFWCVRVQNKFDCTVTKICPFKRDFTALLLSATQEPFSFFQYIIVTIAADEGYMLGQEKGAIFKSALCLDDYQIFELLLPRGSNFLIMHSSAQQCSWWPAHLNSIFQCYIESWQTNCRD